MPLMSLNFKPSKRAKTGKGKRFLASREAKEKEPGKTILMLNGNRTSAVIKAVMQDLYCLKRTEAVRLTRLNENCRPFEAGGEVEIERLAAKADASIFVLASSTKKRPHNLVMGRLFDGHLYDAIEVGVDSAEFMEKFSGKSNVGMGNKPCVVFAGEFFETEDSMKTLRSVFLDFFKGPPTPSINLAGIDRVIAVAAESATKVTLRQYRIMFKKSGTKIPRVALEEMGPKLSMTMRRHRQAPPDLAKEAMIRQKEPNAPKKVKNIDGDFLAGTVGKVYVPKQDIDSMALMKMKGLKRERTQERVAAKTAKKSKSKDA